MGATGQPFPMFDQQALPPRRHLINRTSLPLPHGDDDHYDLGVTYFVDQPVANAAQFDLVAILAAAQFGSGHAGVVEAFRQFAFELLARMRVELSPFLERFLKKAELVTHAMPGYSSSSFTFTTRCPLRASAIAFSSASSSLSSIAA